MNVSGSHALEGGFFFPCARHARVYLPALRSLLARQLVSEQGLRPSEAARALGVSKATATRDLRRAIFEGLSGAEQQALRAWLSASLCGSCEERLQAQRSLCSACPLYDSNSLLCRWNRGL